MNSKRHSVAIIQPAYIPWKGFFDFIASVDTFVLFDNVDYVRRTWYSRNCIKVGEGKTKWLSIPVDYSQSTPTTIHRTPIQAAFAKTHLDAIRASYSKAPFFSQYFPALEEKLLKLEKQPFLSDVTIPLIEWILAILGIKTTILRSSDYDTHGKATEKLLHLCQKIGATHYVSGPAAKVYFKENLFNEAGISVSWMDYSGYPEYPQLHGTFTHGVTILDLLFTVGEEATNYMKCKVSQ